MSVTLYPVLPTPLTAPTHLDKIPKPSVQIDGHETNLIAICPISDG